MDINLINNASPSHKFTLLLIVLFLLSACSEENSNEPEVLQSENLSCLTESNIIIDDSSDEISNVVSSEEISYFGDGMDGEFYLASGEVFNLEEKSYNYSNVYLEADSILSATDQVKEGVDSIQINSVGSCNILGDINLVGYRGTLIINCYSQINLGGAVNVPNGSLSIITSTVEITNPDQLLNLGSGATLGDSITITDGMANIITAPIIDSSLNICS